MWRKVVNKLFIFFVKINVYMYNIKIFSTFKRHDKVKMYTLNCFCRCLHVTAHITTCLDIPIRPQARIRCHEDSEFLARLLHKGTQCWLCACAAGDSSPARGGTYRGAAWGTRQVCRDFVCCKLQLLLHFFLKQSTEIPSLAPMK